MKLGVAMGNGIFLIKDGESLVAMSERAYNSEALLHELLGRYPDLLAGESLDRSQSGEV